MIVANFSPFVGVVTRLSKATALNSKMTSYTPFVTVEISNLNNNTKIFESCVKRYMTEKIDWLNSKQIYFVQKKKFERFFNRIGVVSAEKNYEVSNNTLFFRKKIYKKYKDLFNKINKLKICLFVKLTVFIFQNKYLIIKNFEVFYFENIGFVVLNFNENKMLACKDI